jgi:DNA-binding CsgD family transcriptional regulator
MFADSHDQPQTRLGAARSLTRREAQIAALIRQEGLRDKEIARRLEIATDTVKAHVRSIRHKLRVNSRFKIARYPLVQRGAW